jgi:hypothetical protein
LTTFRDFSGMGDSFGAERVAGFPESLLDQGASDAGQSEVKVPPFGMIEKGEFLGQSEVAHAENTRDTPAALQRRLVAKADCPKLFGFQTHRERVHRPSSESAAELDPDRVDE